MGCAEARTNTHARARVNVVCLLCWRVRDHIHNCERRAHTHAAHGGARMSCVVFSAHINSGKTSWRRSASAPLQERQNYSRARLPDSAHVCVLGDPAVRSHLCAQTDRACTHTHTGCGIRMGSEYARVRAHVEREKLIASERGAVYSQPANHGPCFINGFGS